MAPYARVPTPVTASVRRDYRAASMLVSAVFFGLMTMLHPSPSAAQDTVEDLLRVIDEEAAKVEASVIEWRRDIHAHPELSNREFRTAGMAADHLESLGMEVRTGIAHTGVVGVLRGGGPGPVVGLRADMDALPVTEQTGLPFASTVRAEYNGADVGVMHACGHDCHTSILMGVARVLAAVRERLPCTVVFFFQPAEEGAPSGERGGADLMIEEGALEDPAPGAMFGLHVSTDYEAGVIGYRPEGAMASADGLRITVTGSQTHGAYPWMGVDPVVVSAQIILGLQTIVSRQLDAIQAPSVITVGMINGGIRSNIIPDEVRMVGTIRTLDPDMRWDIHKRIETTAVNIAESAGAKADVSVGVGVPVTYNDPELTAGMLPVLGHVVGEENLVVSRVHTGAEDFAFFAEKVPSLYIFLGVRPKGVPDNEVAPVHSPLFRADEDALSYGVRALAGMAAAYLSGN